MGSFLPGTRTLTATAVYPELCVEWLPTVGPGAEDGPWCDITPFVSKGRSSRGRRYETDQFGAGTLELELKVDPSVAPGRLFDPEWTAGPFYPYLVPMRQIRVSAVWNGTYYPVFRGFVTDWGQTIWEDKVFVTTITARDAFVVFEQIKLPSSAWVLLLEDSVPSNWFRLGDKDTTTAVDSAGGSDGQYVRGVVQDAPGLVVGDADGAATFAHSSRELVAISDASLISGYPFSIGLLFKIDNREAATKIAFAAYTDGSAEVVLRMEPGTNAGQLTFTVNGAGGLREILGGNTYDDNVPHHVVCVATSSSDFVMYVDGALEPTTLPFSNTPTWPGPFSGGYAIGNYPDTFYGEWGWGTNAGGVTTEIHRGTIDEVTIWDGVALTAEQIADLAAAAFGWTGDRTGERIARLLDLEDWSVGLRDIDTGASTLGASSWSDGSTLLSELQKIANTETGALFMGTAGQVVFHSRHAHFLDTTSAVSQATFGDTHSSATLKFADLQLPRDETLIRNPVRAPRHNGITAIAQDAAGIEKYGNRDWTAPEAFDASDNVMTARAAYLVGRYKELGTRLASMKVLPRANPSGMWPQALGREIADRITILRTPLNTGNQIANEQYLERVEHNFSPTWWETTWTGSPIDPTVLAVWDSGDAWDDGSKWGY